MTRPPGDFQGSNKGQILFIQMPVKFGIKLIRKLYWIKIWHLVLLNVVKRCTNWKVTVRPDPSGGSQGSNKGQIPFFEKPVVFGIKLIRTLL